MAYSFDDLAERERRRWTRENAHLWIRHDAHRFKRPDAARFIPPGAKGWKHPDEKLWNFHAAYQRRARPAPEIGENLSFAAELARLQTQHDSIRRAFVEFQQERRQKRALERTEAERVKRRYDAAWDKFIAAFNRHWDACRKANFDLTQPRVPAGNPDGGQWTDSGGSGGGGRNDPRVLSDATPDNESIPGARYAQNETSGGKRDRAEGHHYVPRAVYKDREFPPETSKVFDDAKTGRLHVVGNRWDGPHRLYNQAVKDLLDRFIDTNGIQEQKMTPDQARSFLKEVMESPDPRIRHFNMSIRLREFLYRLRTGIRRGE